MVNKPLFGKTLGQMQARNQNRAVATNVPSNRVKRDIHVFDNGGGYYHTTEFPKVLAEGSVIRDEMGWYIQFRGNLSPINFVDIPSEAKTTMLLLGLSL